MIESPTKPVAASPDDRPIVVGRIEYPDFYVLAHEAKSRGKHIQAVDLLLLAAQQLGIHYGHATDSVWEWETHIECVDRAWGEKQKQLAEQSQPAPRRLHVIRVPDHDLFIDALVARDSDRPVLASTLLHLIAACLEVEGDWTGTVDQDWDRNFDAVHRAWLKKWESRQCHQSS